jgi:two-component system cell cycle sensor histidine kinase/response regulator CckA
MQPPASSNATRSRPATARHFASKKGHLIVVAGGRWGRRFKLEQDNIIGRGQAASLRIDLPGISRKHARIRVVDGAYQIEDLGSLNGIAVNDVPVSQAPLQFGDQILLGTDVLLLFTPYNPTQEQLRQRQRLEALGRMASGCAHDFNNMLAAVLANLDYAIHDGGASSQAELQESLLDAREAAIRAAELSQRMLSFGRASHRPQALVDVSSLCNEVVRLLQRTTSRAIDFHVHIESGLDVHGDAVQLHQVLMNLCLNACDAMGNGGRLELTGMSDHGKEVVLTVRDTGPGMDASLRKRIFEPFFTTKADGGSFGLGLSIVKDSIEAHGGHINVLSVPRHGTTFVVTLPSARRTPADLPSVATQPPVEVTPRTILVVDDEDIARRGLVRLLKSDGHTVIETCAGEDALRVYAEAEHRVELVILDLDMPGLGGLETLARLRKIAPTVRVLICSGHEGIHTDEISCAGAVGYLPKPCGKEALREALTAALTRRRDEPTLPTLPRFPAIRPEDETS